MSETRATHKVTGVSGVILKRHGEFALFKWDSGTIRTCYWADLEIEATSAVPSE